MKTEYHGGSVAGGTFPAEIWGDYMKAVKGKFCGDFKPAKTAAHFTPFFGKYARGGGRNTGDSKDAFGNPITPSTGTTTPTTPAPSQPDNGEKDNGKFNPDLYESPPQGEPDAKPPASDDPAGGAEAPTG